MQRYVGMFDGNRTIGIDSELKEIRFRRSRSTKVDARSPNNRSRYFVRETGYSCNADRETLNKQPREWFGARMAYGTPTNWARNRKVRHWVCFIRTWHKQRLNPQLQSLARYADRISVWHTCPLIFERAVSGNERTGECEYITGVYRARKNGLFLPCLRPNIKWSNCQLYIKRKKKRKKKERGGFKLRFR